jgi:DNA-binding NtrC family response regulator
MRCLNCGAIPVTLVETVLFGHERGAFTGADRAAPGIFEQADGGTVMLDEIGDLPAGAQAAFLRVVETMRVSRLGGAREIPVDVRILAATNRDLDALCARGAFRADLLYRLNALRLRLPPLRERPEDLEPLARQFVREANRANRCSAGALEEKALAALHRYAWPGNVRELRNVIERAVVIARDRDVVIEDLPEQVRNPGPPAPRRSVPPGDLREALRRFEREMIAAALERTGGNQSEAARALGIPLRTLVRRLGEYGLRPPRGGG